jgi:hypothetical protein
MRSSRRRRRGGQMISSWRSRQQAIPRVLSAVRHGATAHGFGPLGASGRLRRGGAGRGKRRRTSRPPSTTSNWSLPSRRPLGAARLVGTRPVNPCAAQPTASPPSDFANRQGTWSTASATRYGPSKPRGPKSIAAVCPSSQVASWSAEDSLSVSSAIRSLTGSARQWGPTREQGGTGFGTSGT